MNLKTSSFSRVSETKRRASVILWIPCLYAAHWEEIFLAECLLHPCLFCKTMEYKKQRRIQKQEHVAVPLPACYFAVAALLCCCGNTQFVTRHFLRPKASNKTESLDASSRLKRIAWSSLGIIGNWFRELPFLWEYNRKSTSRLFLMYLKRYASFFAQFDDLLQLVNWVLFNGSDSKNGILQAPLIATKCAYV